MLRGKGKPIYMVSERKSVRLFSGVRACVRVCVSARAPGKLVSLYVCVCVCVCAGVCDDRLLRQ